MKDIIVINPSDLKTKMRYFLEQAEIDRVFIKKGKKYIELVVSEKIYTNPSPSGDPFFDDPENLREISKGIEDVKAGRVKKLDMKALKKEIE